MKEEAPSAREWKALLEASVEFHKLRCWEWMFDSDLFGVQNPETGEVGYCCVMGNLGQLFALGVYLGSDGLESYEMLQSGAIPQESPDLLLYQRCLMVSFENRSDLTPQDLKMIKESGLKFRGSKVWPQFRSYRPGYVPWHLTGDEARFLTIAIEQSIDVVPRFKENKELFPPHEADLYFVRVPRRTQSAVAWEDQILRPEPYEEEELPPVPLDEERLENIKKIAEARAGVWEMDFIPVFTPIRDEERPFFPRAMLLVDKESLFILHCALGSPADYREKFQDEFLGILEKIKALPREVHVSDYEVGDLLLPISEHLGFDLRLAKELEAIEYARNALFEFTQGGWSI